MLAEVAGAALGSTAASMALGPPPTSMGIIKERGGNWLDKSIDNQMTMLKREIQYGGIRPPAEQLAEMEARYTPEAMATLTPELRDYVQNNFNMLRPLAQIENWIDTKLSKYIRNEMGTESDPIRALAERGVLHVNPDQVGVNRYRGTEVRSRAGMPRLGVSDTATAWEDASDVAINKTTPKTLLEDRMVGASFLAQYPWMQQVPSDARVYGLDVQKGAPEALGLDHMIDELKNATRPNTDLPERLRIDANKLDRMSVAQIVEKVADINSWRVENMSKANQALANNAATHFDLPFGLGNKTYPETGLRWAQLRMPDGETDPTTLQAALKYEGDTMGHCVGGYCDDVAANSTQIFSLRDAKGAPHVTIEVQPYGSYNEDHMFAELTDKLGRQPTDNELQSALSIAPPRIIQIKGKGNAAPAEKYLPAVQDFISSRTWSDVGDLSNAKMVLIGNGRYIPEAKIKEIADRNFVDSFGNKPDQDEDAYQYYNRIRRYNPDMLSEADKNFLNEVQNGNFASGGEVLAYAKGGAVTSSRRMLDGLYGTNAKGQRFAEGGAVDAELLRRQLEGIDNTPSTRAPERAPTPEQTESRTMLERLGRFASLDTPQDMGLGETAADIGMGFLPVVGTAQGARDFERARRDEDKLGMLLSAASMIPVAGGAVRAIRSAGKASRAADDLAALTAQVPTNISQPSAALDMPPLENAQRTQLGSSTIPSYAKAREILSSKNRILDFGAGRGQGASLIGADTFEPYPREGFNPNFSNVADIPSGSYDGLTSLNVLNVMPREVRDDAVRNIGRILADDGEAVITTRGRDVMTAKGVDGPEPMSRITTADTYQKGFTQQELTDYVSNVLGENFVVGSLPQKIGAAGVLVKKTKASNNTGSAAGEARQMLDAVTQAAMPRTPAVGMPVNFSGLRQAGVSPQELRQIDESFRTHQGAVQSVDELVSTAARVDPLFQESVLDVANSIGGTYVQGPLKTPESISEKLVRKGGSAAEVPDSVRATILVQNNEQAEEAIRQIAGRYPMIDEGWQRVPSNGYIDRKLAIQFTGPNGERLLGEIQINTPPMQTVKDTIGHTLYEVERRLIQQSGGVTQMSPEELMRYRSVVEQQSQVYGEAASSIDPSIIKQVTDKRARGGYIGRLGRL
jgi:hypothetical protein